MRFAPLVAGLVLIGDGVLAQVTSSHAWPLALVAFLACAWSPARLFDKLLYACVLIVLAPAYNYAVLQELFFVMSVLVISKLVRRVVHGAFWVRFVGCTGLMAWYGWSQGIAWTIMGLSGTLILLLLFLKYTAQDAWTTAYAH